MTYTEILERLEKEVDVSILRERLADHDLSEYIPHDQVVADLNG